MTTPKQVIDLFSRLSAEDKMNVLSALQSVNPQSGMTKDYIERHQALYREPPRWSSVSRSGPDHQPEITITLFTNHGSYTGVGPNQKMAKLQAVKQAEMDLKD